ncbi:hypothetical protein NIES2135_34650 [Leptolyngbya boryana NIES-2135]|uniref:Uncharacterized protein n=1 Tax=Leptolyngbya boryana NIES-2135 TaxID=1973484 RepID=A0A1Z4JIP8_LEPBY|nr:hypothetical protein NIES2135_34650 [Leptolyngbya boryana NIES-2135]
MKDGKCNRTMRDPNAAQQIDRQTQTLGTLTHPLIPSGNGRNRVDDEF